MADFEKDLKYIEEHSMVANEDLVEKIKADASNLSPSQAWERGIRVPEQNTRRKPTQHVTYSREAVMRYKVPSIEHVLDNTSVLLNMVQHHYTKQVDRLNRLEDYYLALNPAILEGERRSDTRKSDHRAPHAFADNLANFTNAYTLGNPVKIEVTTENNNEADANDFKKLLDKFNQSNDINAHNLELGLNQNIFGQAYELIYQNEKDQTKTSLLPPQEVFMIYDNTIAEKVVGACWYRLVQDWSETDANKRNKYRITLYTPDNVYTYNLIDEEIIKTDKSANLTLNEENGVEEHSFFGVPIIENRSNGYKMGIFEKQIPLIDLYDSAQSDTANYMTDFNDATMVIKNGKIANANATTLQAMADANVVVIESTLDGAGNIATSPDVSYLTKSYDVAGVEKYKDRIKTDIYTQSNIPDLSDTNFSGNQSGEAMKYKTFGLEQKRADKEKYFAKSLRVRYKLFENLMRATHQYTGDAIVLNFSFTPNLPQAYLEELKTFVSAGGRVSLETMLDLLSFIPDSKEELIKIANGMHPDYFTEMLTDEALAGDNLSMLQRAELMRRTNMLEENAFEVENEEIEETNAELNG